MTEERDEAERPAPPAFESPPAPVVTDEGVYGTLPRRPARADHDAAGGPSRHPVLVLSSAVLIIAGALWLLVLSGAQATGETVAIPTIGRGVDALTGLETLLELHEEDIREAATEVPAGDQPVAIPGFEVAGVSISRTEILEGSTAEWHALLRERAARAIYANGVDVLAASGTATDGGVFSASGGARLLMETLSESRHSLASILVLPLTAVVALAVAGALAFGRGFGRFQALGFALAIAALPAIAAGLFGLAILAIVGGGSALADEVHAMASEVVRVPLRNGLTLLAAALVVGVLARVLGSLFRARTDEPDYADEPVPSR